MKKYIFIVLIITLTSIALYLYNKPANGDDISAVRDATTTTTSTSTDEVSLQRFVSNIYSNKKYSNSKDSACINSLLQSLDSIKGYVVVTKFCPKIPNISRSGDFDFFAHPYTEKTLAEYVLINDLFNNPEPIEKYLKTERGSEDKVYREIYARYIYSKTIGDISERLSDSYYSQYDGGEITTILSFDFMNVSSGTDLVLTTDQMGSGAYNSSKNLHQVNFTKDGIDIDLPVIVDDLTHYTKNPDDLTNSYFDKENKTFNIYGFKPFGVYPCHIIRTYSFFDDRLILTSKRQAKDCKKYNINEPDDIPEDFDSTLEEIYKISPSLLEKAKKMII